MHIFIAVCVKILTLKIQLKKPRKFGAREKNPGNLAEVSGKVGNIGNSAGKNKYDNLKQQSIDYIM